MSAPPKDQSCPLCGRPNQCRMANGSLYKGPCWCEQSTLPANLLRFFVEGRLERSCFCGDCFSALLRQARDSDDPAEILARVAAEKSRLTYS